MKKKYIQYRSGLFIGLLSLSTLSSCVNTGQELGMRSSKDRSNNSPFSNSAKDTAKEVVKGLICASLGGAVGFYAGSSSKNCDSSDPSSYNASSSTSSRSNSTGWGTSDPSWS